MAEDEYDDFFNMDLTSHRYPNGWSEENWEQELEQHPMFMTKQPESNELPPVIEALRQLKYGEDDNTKEELVQNYKEDGNRYFKVKNYRLAAQCYTSAINQKVDSKELNSILFANRSAANFYLKKYRSSLLDALKSVELNSRNSKAVQRVMQCLNKLEKYSELIRFIENQDLEIPNRDELKKDAAEKLELKERDRRKANLKERKEKQAITEYQNKTLQELHKRNIKFKVDNLFQVVHPAAADSKVRFNEDDGSICFPVLFVYPEVANCDFIEKFHEHHQLYQHLVTILDDEHNQPEWNANRMFTSESVTVKFMMMNSAKDEIPVDKYESLVEILRNPKLVLHNILLTFSVTCKS